MADLYLGKRKRLVWLTVNRSWSHSSLALPLIHSAAAGIPGWLWERCETTTEEDPVRIAAWIVKEHCDLLCATLYLFNRLKVMDVLKRVHALSPETHIAVGGPECAASDAEKILCDHPFISTVFSGEGEKIFPGFLRDFDNCIKSRQVIPVQKNAVYDDWVTASLPVEDPFFRSDKPFVQIETSRGCPMACAYCTSSGVAVRYRDLSSVERELNLLHERGIREIRVLDRTFNLPLSRGAALLRLFRQFPDMKFHLEVHPQFLNDELRECFRDALPGQLHIEAGVQSLDPVVQQVIGRKSEADAVLDGLQFLTRCRGFETHTDLLAGLPAQTLDSLQRDIVRLIKIRPAEIQLEILKMLPGTAILRQAGAYGMVWSPDPPYDVMSTASMSVEDILQATFLSRLLDLFYNHPVTHKILLAASEERSAVFLELAVSLREKDLNTLMDLKKRLLFLDEFFQTDCLCARTENALQWLMTGYPSDEGPGRLGKPVHELPEAAHCLSGPPESRSHRASRFLHLRHCNRDIYIVTNRFFRCGKPCSLWIL